MVHFWCSFGAFAPKVHQTAGALSALLHQKCTKTAQGNGALLALLHQKCTRNAPPLESAPYGQNASKVHQKRCTFGSFSPKVHQKCTLHWCTFGAFAPKEHQNCTSVAAELLEIWKKLENFSKKIPEKFDRLGKFSKNFPKFFQISSNTARALVQFWCSFGATAPQVHQALISFASARL